MANTISLGHNREGVITCAVGILLCFTYPTDPADTKMLNEEERELAIARLNQGQLNGATTDRDEKFSLKETLKIISHPQIMVATFFFICNNVTVQGLNSFLPYVLRACYSVALLTSLNPPAAQSFVSTTPASLLSRFSYCLCPPMCEFCAPAAPAMSDADSRLSNPASLGGGPRLWPGSLCASSNTLLLRCSVVFFRPWVTPCKP